MWLLQLLLAVAFLNLCASHNVTECYKAISPGAYTNYLGTENVTLAITRCSLPNAFCIVMTDLKNMRYLDCLSTILWKVKADPSSFGYNNLNCVRNGCTSISLNDHEVTYCCYDSNLSNLYKSATWLQYSSALILSLLFLHFSL